ncbi:LysE family translocator [Silvimonas iriomotensis]|uniref:Lysine transporter LysE n=1 Tax=Silvimonas iriomotensis TaxID=449662 RepID=A0ABQ2P9X3_9NEIS|nr:LysE family translocator [Silvimonas iriomotensis]GGP22056.1 lysine transporter LysE [Silvimonas iriomotensis]
MLDALTLSTYAAVVLALMLVPGPAVLLLLTRTAQGGTRVGLATGAGIALGDFIHTLVAAAGLSTILMTSAVAFSVVKYVGAAYLVYLGVRAIKAPLSQAHPAVPAARHRALITPWLAFWQAVPAEVLNPKTALFFLAFLPQFVHAERGHVLAQFLQLGLVFVVLSISYTSVLVLATRPLARVVRHMGWLRRWQNKLVGTLFLALGLKVALQKQ